MDASTIGRASVMKPGLAPVACTEELPDLQASSMRARIVRIEHVRIVQLHACRDDVRAGSEDPAKLRNVEDVRHVEHAIGAEREDILDAVGGGNPNCRNAGQIAGVAPNLVEAVHVDAHELEIRMLDRATQGACSDIARGPLDHAVALCRTYSLLHPGSIQLLEPLEADPNYRAPRECN